MCGGKRGGMRMGREGEGEKRGQKGQKPSLGSFCLPPCLLSPGFPEHPPQSAISSHPSPSLVPAPPPPPDFLSSDDFISVVFLCPSSWKNLSRDMELPGRGVWGLGFSPCPFSAHACQGSTGTRDWRLPSVPSTSSQPELRPLLYISLSSNFSSHSPFL